MAKRSVELRQQIEAKHKELAEVYRLAGDDRDFSKKDVLEKLGATDSKDAVEKVKARNLELEQLGVQLDKEVIVEIEENQKAREARLRTPAGLPAPVDQGPELKTLGNLFTAHDAYVEHFKKHKLLNHVAVIDIPIKTLFQTSAGYAPESVRTGLLVEAVTRPVFLLDFIPTRPIAQAVDKYMEETTRTHAAAEKAEAAAYAESTFVWTEKTSPVQKITDSIPVTDEQLEDAPEIAAVLDQRLRFGLRQRLDLQILVGDGTAPNLSGILDVSGIQTQAKGADPAFDAVYKAMTKVRFTGRAIPGLIIMHPNDWQDIRLARTADGIYLLGSPAEVGPQTLFGLPVVLTDAVTENTAIVGDVANFCYIGERRGIDVQIGYSGTQFVEGKKTIRADLRACFTVTRPAAFCSVTGL